MRTLYVTEQIADAKGTREYRITKAVDTVLYDIGTVLSRGVVNGYCRNPQWKINITAIGV